MPSAALKMTYCGSTSVVPRELRGDRLGGQVTRLPCPPQDGGASRATRVRAEDRHGAAIARRNRTPLQARPAGQLLRGCPLPREPGTGATPIDVPLVRRVQHGRPSGVRLTCSTSHAPGVSRAGTPPASRDRVQVRPPVLLPREDQPSRPRPSTVGSRHRAHGTRCRRRRTHARPHAPFRSRRPPP